MMLVFLLSERLCALNREQATLFYQLINTYVQQQTNTVKELDSTKSHTLKIICKSNFALSIAWMWALCQAVLTEEPLYFRKKKLKIKLKKKNKNTKPHQAFSRCL